MSMGFIRWGVLLAPAALACLPGASLAATEMDPSKLPPPASKTVDFTRDIQPLLQAHCLKCHSDEKPKSSFRLTSRQNALKGGEHRIDLIPGKSGKSPLVYYVARLVPDMEMPPDGRGTPLTSNQVALVRAWIDQGLAWGPITNAPPIEVALTPVVGGTAVRGDARKFRELYWQHESWNRGLEDFHMEEKPGPNSKITSAGHILRDDYKLTLSAEKNDLGFANFGWEQFRKYYDNLGGYSPLFSPPAFELNRDLQLDVGRAWTEFGLTLPGLPRVVLGYEYDYRDGTDATLQWGPVSNGVDARNIYPGFKQLSEQVHVLKLDADYEAGGVLISDSFRGEWYKLNSEELNDSGFTNSPGNPAMALTSANERQTYFEGANTLHLEKQFTKWLFGAGGYLYSKLNADGSMDVQNDNAALLNNPGGAFSGFPGWQIQPIELERESHVFSLSSLLGPCEGLSITLAVQNEWTRQNGLDTGTSTLASALLGTNILALGYETNLANLDQRTFSQELGIRFTKIPFTTLFAEARFQENDLGRYESTDGGLTPFLLYADEANHQEDLRAGFNTSPWRRLSLSGQVQRYDDNTVYNNIEQRVILNEGYPGFIRRRDLISNKAEGKLGYQAATWLKTTLSYQYLANDYHTYTAPVALGLFPPVSGVSPGGAVAPATYDAHIASFNATLTPWRRLFLSTTFSYQNARTVTGVIGSPSVVPYAGNIYQAIVSGNYALNESTDLILTYSFAFADFTQAPDSLPLGIKYHQHTLEAGIQHRLAKNTTVGLQYQFYHYDEPSSGGVDNFNAQGLFATLACRLP